MSSSIKVERTGHHAEHLGSGQEWIIALHFDLMCIVGDEFESSSLRVEYLAAARHEARALRLRCPDRVRNSDVGCLGIRTGQLPGNSAGLRVQGQPDAPRNAGAI